MNKNRNAALIYVHSRAVRQVVVKAAQDAGYAVRVADSRSEAYDAIRSDKPALMFVDLRLPEGTGILHEIGTTSPTTALVMLPDDDQSAADLEFFALAAGISTAVAVARPIRMGALAAAIDRARSSEDTPPDRDVATDLEAAIAEDEIDVSFLPRVRLTIAGDHFVVGFEAQASWHPRGGARIDHKALLCAAHRNGLSNAMLEILLRAIARHNRKHAFAGAARPTVIPMHPAILYDPNIAAQIATILDDEGLDPENIIVRICEPAATADPDALLVFLAAMSARGIPVSLGNFGISHVSVTALARAGFCDLVLDETLVTALKLDERAQGVVRALVAMADALGFEICADGVDCAASARLLASLGCSVQQGPIFTAQIGEARRHHATQLPISGRLRCVAPCEGSRHAGGISAVTAGRRTLSIAGI